MFAHAPAERAPRPSELYNGCERCGPEQGIQSGVTYRANGVTHFICNACYEAESLAAQAVPAGATARS